MTSRCVPISQEDRLRELLGEAELEQPLRSRRPNSSGVRGGTPVFT